MSWTKYIALNCDECFAEKDGLSFSVKEARDEASDWYFIDGRDYCNECFIKLYPAAHKHFLGRIRKSMSMPNLEGE